MAAAEDCAEHLQRVSVGDAADVAFVSDVEQREPRELVVSSESAFGSLLRLGHVYRDGAGCDGMDSKYVLTLASA